jgi:site-specific DNA recombinase
MIAAIYARKSTDQSGVADEQRSIARQVDHARAYATRKGWTVDPACIFVDDGISGAEFSNRPGFLQLMSALKPRPPFEILVMSEESRLGREAIETAFALKQIITAGVRVFLYLEDRERELSSPMEKAMLSLQTMADEMERDKARLRVTDAMSRKARAGYSCGGTCFGYDNRPVFDATGRRSHVERRINETEAAVIRRIFDLCALGVGYTRIAKLLNVEHAPAPRPKQGRPTGWAPTSVKEILDRETYHGELVWNRTRKSDAWGQKRPSARPETEWIRISMPDLRIVSDEQWRAAHARLDGIRAQLVHVSGGRLGVRRRDVDSQYLLSGFARCAVCGGGLGVMSGSHRSARGHVYGCLAYLKRGTSVCGNGLRLPLDRVDQAVLRTLAGDVLRPPVVMAIIEGVLAALNPRAIACDVDALREELRHLERQAANLAKAIAVGGQLEPLLVELRACQTRRNELVKVAAARELVDIRRFDRKAIEAQVRDHVGRWRALLTKHVHDGRQLLREVLAGPLRFTPEGKTYRFEGQAAFGGMLAGMAGVAPFVVAVRRSSQARRSSLSERSWRLRTQAPCCGRPVS